MKAVGKAKANLVKKNGQDCFNSSHRETESESPTLARVCQDDQSYDIYNDISVASSEPSGNRSEQNAGAQASMNAIRSKANH